MHNAYGACIHAKNAKQHALRTPTGCFQSDGCIEHRTTIYNVDYIDQTIIT